MSYYAVHKGRKPGIYKTWKECEEQVKRYKGAIYKKFKKKQKADEFLEKGRSEKSKMKSTKTHISKSNQKNSPKNNTQPKTKKHNNSKNPTMTIYTDGSCIRRQNKYYCGYGYYIPSKNVKVGNILPKKSGYSSTNNRAEMTAIIEGVQRCVSYFTNDFPDTPKKNLTIQIHTDSKYSILIGTTTGQKYKKNNWKVGKKQVKNKDLVKKLVSISENYTLQFNHVYAHTSGTDIHSIGNEIADQLAKSGALSDYRSQKKWT